MSISNFAPCQNNFRRLYGQKLTYLCHLLIHWVCNMQHGMKISKYFGKLDLIRGEIENCFLLKIDLKVVRY